MPTDQNNNIWEFEPGAAGPLFFRVQPKNPDQPLNLTNAQLKLVLTLRGIDHEIMGEWDAEREGYSVNTNSWASVIRQSKLTRTYVYMDWGDGWRRTGYMDILPMEGATWQRSA